MLLPISGGPLLACDLESDCLGSGCYCLLHLATKLGNTVTIASPCCRPQSPVHSLLFLMGFASRIGSEAASRGCSS